jgi:C-terminal processing protease CtpA/Prc
MSTSARAETLAADFLANVDAAVAEEMGASVTLADFIASAPSLTLAERRLLVEQAMVLLERNYVHLDLKTAMHAVDPLQRLRLLLVQLRRARPDETGSDRRFHSEMSEIFHSLRDLHTNYLLPEPYSGKIAYLPFMIEEYRDDDGQRRYLVSHVVDGFDRPPFGAGVEVTHWSGIPIDTAIELNADRFAGSNRAARHARGLESLTIRPLVIHIPPYEQWVTLTYRTDDDAEHTLRQEWLVVDNLPAFIDADEVSGTAASLGLDLDADEAGRARTLLFAPAVAKATREEAAEVTDAPAAPGDELPTTLPSVFRARSISTSSGVFGHIRIFTFNVRDPDGFVDEFLRLIGLLPPDGLIIDVRGNGGGHIHASENTLQTLTPRTIKPEPVQFSSSDLNLTICRRHKDNPTGQIDLTPWFTSLDLATETGAEYSGAFPITPTEGANARGQQYYGPVVLITDARCYSATDIFAAGFADHRIGTILGVDDNTGAGGANVWTHGLLTALLQFPTPDEASPYVALPRGANMRVSMRRTLRVGDDNTGTPVEDLGVTPDVIHRMTRDDVLHGNRDLLDKAGELLAGQPVRQLDVIADLDEGGALTLDIETQAIDRVDVYVDDRPHGSYDVSDGTTSRTVSDDVPGATRLRVEGYDDGELVAARALDVTRDGDAATSRTTADVPARRTTHATAGMTTTAPTVVYIHGAGNKPDTATLKRGWDLDLFQRDMGDRSVMTYYADVLHRTRARIGADACATDDAVNGLVAALSTDGAATDHGLPVSPLLDADLGAVASTEEGQAFAARLQAEIAGHPAARARFPDPTTGVLPLPSFIEELILRELLRRLVPDAEAYFFKPRKRDRMRARLRSTLKAVQGPAIVVSHSLGTAIAYDVLREPAFGARDIPLFVTLGSPLGYQEIQARVTTPLRVPRPVDRWTNAADRLDVVALDTGLNNDFNGGMKLIDVRVDNISPNHHAACGYLRTEAVRTTVGSALAAAPVS